MYWVKRHLGAPVLVLSLVLTAILALVACDSDAPEAPVQAPVPTTAGIEPTVAPASVAPPRQMQASEPTVTPAVSRLATPPPPTTRPIRPSPPTATPEQAPPEPEQPAGPTLPSAIVDVHGNEVVVEDVSRIVVMNGDVTEVVYALGLGGNVVAVDTSATYPQQALALPKIGYQRSLSAEGILSMAPTVVIGNTNAGPPEVLEQIRATGVPVVILDNVSTIAGASRKIRSVAQALGVPEKGEELAAALEEQIGEVIALSAQAEDKPTAVFLYMRGLDSLFLIGQDHLSHELFEASGAVSGAAKVGVMAPFIPLTAEALAATDPDCIVVLTAGLESVGGEEGLLRIPGVGQTSAAEEGCIVDFDDQYFGGGGPRTASVLMDLLQVFHPDLAPTG